MITIWGRANSANVQKAMWAISELGLECERLDAGGPFGKTKDDPDYLAMNPNGLVPTLRDEDGYILWESNAIMRYLASKYDKANILEPKDLKARGLANQWMDWQLGVISRSIQPAFNNLVRMAPEKRDMAAVEASRKKTIGDMAMVETQLGKTAYVAGDSFSYGDIPIGVMCYRFRELVPQHPPMPNLDRWYAAISSRQGFKDHVGSIPLS